MRVWPRLALKVLRHWQPCRGSTRIRPGREPAQSRGAAVRLIKPRVRVASAAACAEGTRRRGVLGIGDAKLAGTQSSATSQPEKGVLRGGGNEVGAGGVVVAGGDADAASGGGQVGAEVGWMAGGEPGHGWVAGGLVGGGAGLVQGFAGGVVVAVAAWTVASVAARQAVTAGSPGLSLAAVSRWSSAAEC
jgi:hypothetical protein